MIPERALLAVLAGVFVSLAVASAGEGRTRVRTLFGFERPSDLADFARSTEEMDVAVVQDNGVTEGRNCARLVAKRGAPWSVIQLRGDALRAWSDFDYFAMDVFTGDEHPYRMVFELWDGRSTNYATRSTYENVTTHPGPQTLLYHIARAKRNSKEGREWEELEPQDKIDLDGLKLVKIFVTPLEDRDAVFWVDNVRLMQEDAAKPKMKIDLPEGAVAFDFGTGGDAVPGFKAVAPETRFGEGSDFGFVDPRGLEAGGKGWPDLLTGTFVWSPGSGRFAFRAKVPDGRYTCLLAAGKVVRSDLKSRRFLLRLNGRSLCDEEPSYEELCSERYLYRFLRTRYSAKPHALWERCIDKMYPVRETTVEVAGGAVEIEARNHFLSAVVLVPAAKAEDLAATSRAVREARVSAFEKTYYAPERKPPERRAGDGALLVYVPDDGADIQPWTGPNDNERARRRIEVAGAPGESVVMRVAAVPFEDAGAVRLVRPRLRGAGGAIPPEGIDVLLEAYRSAGTDVSEMALVPSDTVAVEKGVTRSWWLWLRIPDDAAPGSYRGRVTLAPERRGAEHVPVTLEVYPFALERDLPVSYGMYYGEPRLPSLPPDRRRETLLEQLRWMRRVGFTAIPVGSPYAAGADPGRGTVDIRFDAFWYDLAREAGMARAPGQELMAASLGLARSLARRLPGLHGPTVDRTPGIELKSADFRRLHEKALREYAAFLKERKLPVAVEVVDEPREMPNPWNRNLADTLTYARMLRDAGIRTFVTPMGDGQSGLDYTVLADHIDVISVHAGTGSRGLVERTRRNKRTLWLYNTGMDRFSWGFYAWRVGAVGRWEWHFSWSEDQAAGGYPCREWYNPFTALHGFASSAPLGRYPGAMLFQSCFLEVAEGIRDRRYLLTLERRIEECEKAGRARETVREAKAFLAALGRAIPEYPGVKGIASEADGALVGTGIEGDARANASEWRRRIAGFLTDLSR